MKEKKETNLFTTLAIAQLNGFKNHPYRVEEDFSMHELAKSIKQQGVLIPVIVRKNPDGDGYEIISGHRRVSACKLIGFIDIPAQIVDITDNEAIIQMVDSNLHREKLRISEKAFAYKMKYNALKSQGKRTDLTSPQIEAKLDKDNGKRTIGKRTSEFLAENDDISKAQIERFIRLTYLIPELLNMVDEGVLTFGAGVDISYMPEDEQRDLLAVMKMKKVMPTNKQAFELKKISREKKGNKRKYNDILEEKPKKSRDRRKMISVPEDEVILYLPKNLNEKEKVNHLIKGARVLYEGN